MAQNKSRDSLDQLMQFWRTPLFDLIHESQVTVHHRLELFHLAHTTWADRIVECFPTLVNQSLLFNLIDQLTGTNTQCPLEELHAILPLRSARQLLEKYPTHDSFPPVDLPSVEPDVDGWIWVDRTVNESGLVYEEGTILWMNHTDALVYYADLRRDQPSLILKSFQLAINAYLRTRQTSEKSRAKGNSKQPVTQFPTPPGTKWGEFTIIFVSNDYIRIKARKESHTYHFAQIGFRDTRRTSGPSSIWELFSQLARMNGHLDWEALDLRGRTVPLDQQTVQKKISILRKMLKNLTGLKDDPFHPYRKERAYMTRFSLRDERPID